MQPEEVVSLDTTPKSSPRAAAAPNISIQSPAFKSVPLVLTAVKDRGDLLLGIGLENNYAKVFGEGIELTLNIFNSVIIRINRKPFRVNELSLIAHLKSLNLPEAIQDVKSIGYETVVLERNNEKVQEKFKNSNKYLVQDLSNEKRIRKSEKLARALEATESTRVKQLALKGAFLDRSYCICEGHSIGFNEVEFQRKVLGKLSVKECVYQKVTPISRSTTNNPELAVFLYKLKGNVSGDTIVTKSFKRIGTNWEVKEEIHPVQTNLDKPGEVILSFKKQDSHNGESHD